MAIIFKESGLSRVLQHYAEHDTATISAFRGTNTKAVNKDLSAQLKKELMNKGYAVTPTKGGYIENYKLPGEKYVNEDSYFVVDIEDYGTLKKDIIAFGNKYDQDSVTFAKANGEYYLIGTNDTGYPGLGKEEKLGKPKFGKDAEFYSKVKGRSFVFGNPSGEEE